MSYREKGVLVLIFTDGREGLIERTIQSFENLLVGFKEASKMIIDDSGDPRNAKKLWNLFHNRYQISHHSHRLGFAGSIADAWNHLHYIETPIDYIFHLEDDFVLQRKTRMEDMIKILDSDQTIAQVAMVRQAWNSQEKAAGGLIQASPGHFHQREAAGIPWIEHRRFFTTNPCLYPAELTEIGWPNDEHSEGKFSIKLVNELGYRFAMLGKLDDPPLVMHIGEQRIGGGY